MNQLDLFAVQIPEPVWQVGDYVKPERITLNVIGYGTQYLYGERIRITEVGEVCRGVVDMAPVLDRPWSKDGWVCEFRPMEVRTWQSTTK